MNSQVFRQKGTFVDSATETVRALTSNIYPTNINFVFKLELQNWQFTLYLNFPTSYKSVGRSRVKARLRHICYHLNGGGVLVGGFWVLLHKTGIYGFSFTVAYLSWETTGPCNVLVLVLTLINHLRHVSHLLVYKPSFWEADASSYSWGSKWTQTYIISYSV